MTTRARLLIYGLPTLLVLLIISCPYPFSNNPYPGQTGEGSVLYNSFPAEPKHLDPAKAYSSDEFSFLGQIYEPPLQYHFLKRPYVLVPMTAEEVPEPVYRNAEGDVLSADAPQQEVAEVVYTIRIKQGMQFHDHPAFARDEDGNYVWHLPPDAIGGFEAEHPQQLEPKGTREVTAADYVYQIKRLASPVINCPIYSLLGETILGFDELRQDIGAELKRERAARRDEQGVFYNQSEDERTNPIWLDLRRFECEGLEVVDRYTFRITLSRPYPQLQYWLAMPFFAPMAWEAERFYTQRAAIERDMSLDRHPVGTGPYHLAETQPQYRMVLERNPRFAGRENYPTEGEPSDREQGLLDDAGKPLPFVDRVIYSLEKESAPRWSKFLQGYYDASGIMSDVFDQAVDITGQGVELSDELQKKGISLRTQVLPTIFYYSFNMEDETVGGLTPEKRKLRQALSIALNQEEYNQIFLNGRGISAMGPLPPGIYGHQEGKDGINPFVYRWDEQRQRPVRRNIEEARQLLAEAGYPGGRDRETGEKLVVYLDTTDSFADPPVVAWLRKVFKELGVDLKPRITDYSTFRSKADRGNWQILIWGWNADYPDPENFFFLFYGPNSRIRSQGENVANYQNPEFDKLFKQMETMPNGPERLAIIKKMTRMLQEDSPWIWGFYPKAFGLYHQWYHNAKAMPFGENTLKYKRVDDDLREKKIAEWNVPVTWPVRLVLSLLVLSFIPAAVTIYNRDRKAPGTVEPAEVDPTVSGT